MTRPTKRRVALGFACVVVLAVVGPCRFSYYEVCPVCGRIEYVTERQLPFLPVTYWRSRSVAETPLSREASGDGLAGPHEHAWLFGQGGGNGVMCAIGPGRYLPSVLRSEPVANFIHAVAAYQRKDEAERWLRLALDPQPSNRMRTVLAVTEFPDRGFADREAFTGWWTAHKAQLDLYASPSGE